MGTEIDVNAPEAASYLIGATSKSTLNGRMFVLLVAASARSPWQLALSYASLQPTYPHELRPGANRGRPQTIKLLPGNRVSVSPIRRRVLDSSPKRCCLNVNVIRIWARRPHHPSAAFHRFMIRPLPPLSTRLKHNRK